MREDQTDSPQGPWEGSPCLFAPDEYLWRQGTVRRVNEDGSFKIEPEVPETVMPYWYGVTQTEISFNDSSRWEAIFSRISPEGHSLGLADFAKAMLSFGFHITLEQSRQFWSASCQKLFQVPAAEAEQLIIDREMSYQVFLNLGIAAKYAAGSLELERPSRYFKFYWNQTRMGGREPAEIHRRVTLEDALAALGLAMAGVDTSARHFLERFEREQETRLPVSVISGWCLARARKHLTGCRKRSFCHLTRSEGTITSL